jgi:2-dehydro-3-deoxy-D-arabinonate dehydratase
MKLYKIKTGALLQQLDSFYYLQQPWNELINRNNLHDYLQQQASPVSAISTKKAEAYLHHELMAPIGQQEVWAAGVTYLRSKSARMDESKESGAADLYNKVYDAVRPELFFKALPHRVAGHKDTVNIRKDSTWNVPEPELTLFINSWGIIEAYTIGNDMSSRSIEGENALYLPQAKIYERSAGIGPCLYVPGVPLPIETTISMKIIRNGQQMYHDSTSVSRIKRTLPELADWLYQEMDFPFGSFLMTGTCLVPSNDFTLAEGDVIEITIDGIGTLTNYTAIKK